MTPLSPVSNSVIELKQAIAQKDHTSSLQILKQLPLRKRWDTLLLLQRAFSKTASKDYVRALSHDLLYQAYQAETEGQHTEASRLYRLLIQHSSDHRVTQKARSGYQRIQTGQALPPVPVVLPTAQSLAHHETALLIIQTVAPSQKQSLALKFAQVMKTDPYTARLSLPSIEFRMLRYGPSRDMETLHQSLLVADIPNYHVPLSAIQAIPVHDVLYIKSVADRLVVQIRDPENPKLSMTKAFDWSAVYQRVDGLLPLFEEIIDRNTKGQIVRKTATQDHTQICDLHLSHHQGILRFYDAGYQFNQGISLVDRDSSRITLDAQTSWAQWQGLKRILSESLPPVHEHQKFDHFATNVVEQMEILPHIRANINILRQQDCYWDQAFHLYSALHYLSESPVQNVTQS